VKFFFFAVQQKVSKAEERHLSASRMLQHPACCNILKCKASVLGTNLFSLCAVGYAIQKWPHFLWRQLLEEHLQVDQKWSSENMIGKSISSLRGLMAFVNPELQG
jgi:hypothetical protein